LTPCLDKVFTARQKLAENCAESRETVARWARTIRQDIRRNISRHIRATSRQQQPPCRRMAGRMTHKPTCLAPDMDAQCPRRKLARQLTKISWSTMTPKNYEYTNHTT